MVSTRKFKAPALLLFFWLIFSRQIFAWQLQFARTENNVLISFSEKLAFKSLTLPSESSELWGSNKSCRAAILTVGEQSFIASAGENENEIVFKLNDLAADKVLISPIYIQDSTRIPTQKIKIDAVLAKTREIEQEILDLTLQVQSFQRQNNCFSCHTLLPLALTISEASRRGYQVSLREVEKTGEDVAAMQRPDGSYFFSGQPDYGPISTSLCAGAALSFLVRFDRRLLVNIGRVAQLFPRWLDQENDIKSDFFFRPLFIGKPTSALFEALILAALYYYQPVITEETPNEELRQRLLRLNQRFKISSETAVLQNLLIMAGLPYLGQFSDEARPQIFDTVFSAQQNDAMAARPDSAALAALFYSRIGNKKGLQQLKLLQTQGKTLSEKVWLCLIKVLQHQPQN